MTALARVDARRLRGFGLDRKEMAPESAPSSVATRSMMMAPAFFSAATSSAPVRAASTLSGTPESGWRGSMRAETAPSARLLVGQRLDHPVGDVDARTRVDDVLDYHVEFIIESDLLDRLVGALLHRGQLFVAAQTHVLTKFALHPLQVAVLVGEVALLVASLGLRHGHAVLFQRALQIADLLGKLLDLGVAAGEFLFELLLGALRRRRLAEESLAINEPDLDVGRLGERGSARRGQHHDARDSDQQLLRAVFQSSLLRVSLPRKPFRPEIESAGSCRGVLCSAGCHS